MEDHSNPNTPSPEDKEELILSCRYGDLDDLKAFIERFGTDSVGNVRDENENTVLHMASANGHTGEFLCSSEHPAALLAIKVDHR